MIKVGIVNFGMGNLNSVQNALKFLGCKYTVISNPNEFDSVSHIILPGVGSFKKAMENLIELNLIDRLKKEVIVNKKNILGICLGMQMLGKSSTEQMQTDGLGFVENKVEKFSSRETLKKNIPHVGFNNVKISNKNFQLFTGIKNMSDFYFVHSYRMLQENLNENYATCNYGIDFLAAFKYQNIYGAQFHPEKSQYNGIKMIYNFLKN